jgi:tetratricopeptide (TPR) repeat protein
LAASVRAEEIAHSLHDSALLAEARLLNAQAGWSLGEDVLPALLDVLPMAERIGDLRVLAGALNLVGWVYLYGHADLAHAKTYLDQTLQVAERRGGPYLVLRALADLAHYHYFAGEWRQGRECAERAECMMRQLDRLIWYDVLFALGQLDLGQGRFEDAEHRLVRVLTLAAEWSDVLTQRAGQRLLSERDLMCGHASSAYTRLEPLLEPHDWQGWSVDMLLPLMAWAQLALDRDTEAAATLEACKARCGKLWLVDALRVEAMLAIKQRRWQDAIASLDESLAMCRAMPYPYAEAKALYVYGQLHAVKGEPRLAREKYEAALAICAQLDEGLYRPHIERALAGALR